MKDNPHSYCFKIANECEESYQRLIVERTLRSKTVLKLNPKKLILLSTDLPDEMSTLLPEMLPDENDQSTPTVSRGPKTFDDEECCKCPATKSVDETTTVVDEIGETSTDVDEDETTTELSSNNSTMKDRDGREFGANLIDNEIDIDTTTSKETSETSQTSETAETAADSDDFDASSRK